MTCVTGSPPTKPESALPTPCATSSRFVGVTCFSGSNLSVASTQRSVSRLATIAIVDPPRAGLHPRAFAGLLRAAPQRIVWVSCNLKGAAEDLASLVEAGWTIRSVQPVDLFPHTPHVETVVLLERERP